MDDQNTDQLVDVSEAIKKIDVNEFMQHPALKDVALDNRRVIFSYALALHISRQLEVPTQPVESASAYYMSNLEDYVARYSSKFNEKISIDFDLVRDFTCKLWNIRYTALHMTNQLGSYYPNTFFEIYTGVCNVVDEQTNSIVNENKVAIIDLSRALCEVLK